MLVTRSMVEAMSPGSVVVDLASESGGNVEGSIAGEEVRFGEVLVCGARDVASQMPVHASQLYSMNVFALLGLTVVEGSVVVDLQDEVLDGCAVVHNGEVRSTSDFTVEARGTPSRAATSAQVLLPGVGVLVMALAAAGRDAPGANDSAFSMFAA